MAVVLILQWITLVCLLAAVTVSMLFHFKVLDTSDFVIDDVTASSSNCPSPTPLTPPIPFNTTFHHWLLTDVNGLAKLSGMNSQGDQIFFRNLPRIMSSEVVHWQYIHDYLIAVNGSGVQVYEELIPSDGGTAAQTMYK
jgi:hypothetical protein